MTYRESTCSKAGQKLYHDVDGALAPGEASEDSQTDGNGRIHVRSRDAAAEVDAEHEGEPPSPTGGLVCPVL